MVYCTYEDINLLTNLTSSDISNDDIDSIIAEATKELNSMINVHIDREYVTYIDNTRQNKKDGENKIYYVQNWNGKFLADLDDDGGVDTGDVVVYLVAADGTETQATISAIDADDCYVTLETAPSSGVRVYITYEWCYKDQSTPDPMIKLACIFLTSAYCYAKLNIGMAPNIAFGNTRLLRHMDSFNMYYSRFQNIVNRINSRAVGDWKQSEETF